MGGGLLGGIFKEETTIYNCMYVCLSRQKAKEVLRISFFYVFR